MIHSLIIALISISSIVSVQAFTKYNAQILYNNTADVLSFFSTELCNSMDSMVTSSSVVISDNTIQNGMFQLKYANNPQKKASLYRSLYNAVLNYNYTIPNLETVCLLSPVSTIWSNNHQKEILPSSLALIEEQAAKEKGGSCFIVLKEYDNQLVLARQILRIAGTSLEPLGTLILFVDTNALINSSTNYSTLNDCFYSLSIQGATVYNSLHISKPDIPLDTVYDIIKINGHHYFMLQTSIPNYNWQFECWINYDDICRSITTGHLVFFIALTGTILISLVASGILAGNITKHFYALINKMKNFDGESDDIPKTNYDYSFRKDEIGIVHRNFDSMAREQQRLIKDNYQTAMLMKDTQLKALEQQINPHFLYNTLEAINWHAKSIHETQISSIVESLGNLLHAALERSTRMITLRRELELVQNYITIQQFRFGERLQFHLTVPDELLDISIPKLSIQPLVENSIKYALEENTDVCHIYILILQTDSVIEIYVKNNGSQFDNNLFEHLKSNSNSPHGFGIGLLNIDTRIRLTFGEPYGLKVYNEEENAVARITIPHIF